VIECDEIGLLFIGKKPKKTSKCKQTKKKKDKKKITKQTQK
jgi:hypothetical protein